MVLVPSSAPDYEPLLTDIRQRLDHPAPEAATMPEQIRRMMFGTISPEKPATSAILLNRGDKSIAAMELVWLYEEVGGRTYSHSCATAFGKRLLPPFSTPTFRKIEACWNTILPGSKRYLGEHEMAGDNTDVRLPAPDEMRPRGGGVGGGGAAAVPPTPSNPSPSSSTECFSPMVFHRGRVRRSESVRSLGEHHDRGGGQAGHSEDRA